MASSEPETATLSRPETAPWLTLVGIGEDGRAGLCPEALAALDGAEIVFGGERHIALVGDVPGEKRPWPQPFRNALPAIMAERGRRVCVLATSDPFHYGVGNSLARALPESEMRVLPQISSYAMACTRMRWPQEECALVSLHGRTQMRIVPHLQPKARILALCWDERTPVDVAGILVARGMGESRITVLEALGGPKERIRSARALDFALPDINPLNLIAVEVACEPEAALPIVPGRAEDRFAHDGQITKAEIRALTLAALAPRLGELLWDVGAGSGSVAAEWCLAHPRNRALAFEQKPERLALIERNRSDLGGLQIRTIEGRAPESLSGLEAPDAVFIGGGLTVPGLFEAAWAALKPGGRLVANAVTIESEARLAALHAAHGGSLRRVSIDRLEPVGGMHGWRPAMPVTQWRVVKP